MAGDFNRANLKKVIPEFKQHIDCPTRGERTLDHCYFPFKDGYKATSLPPFGLSDHSAVLLIPKYKQWLKQKSPAAREVIRWTGQSEAALRGALDSVDWDMFRFSSGGDINELTEAVVGFIGKMVEDATPIYPIRTLPNQKPWVDKTVRDSLRACTAAYNSGLATGNMSPYREATYAVRRTVRPNAARLELQMEGNNTRALWQGLLLHLHHREHLEWEHQHMDGQLQETGPLGP